MTPHALRREDPSHQSLEKISHSTCIRTIPCTSTIYYYNLATAAAAVATAATAAAAATVAPAAAAATVAAQEEQLVLEMPGAASLACSIGIRSSIFPHPVHFWQ
jgi:hypothetical protein